MLAEVSPSLLDPLPVLDHVLIEANDAPQCSECHTSQSH